MDTDGYSTGELRIYLQALMRLALFARRRGNFEFETYLQVGYRETRQFIRFRI